MGSAEETTPAKGTPKATPPATPPASVMGQEVPVTPPMYPQDWQSMAAAYYGGAPAAGTPPAAFFHPSSPAPHPFMWANPHMLAPYGASIPYPPIYNHAMYPAHPVAQGTAVAAVEMEGKSTDGKDRNSSKKAKNGSGTANQAPGKSGDGGNTNEDVSQSGDSGDSGSDNTSNGGDGEGNPQGTTANGKRSYDKMVATGKPATNLNIGMDIWNTSTSGKERSNSMNISPPIAPTAIMGQNGAMTLTTQDERELKRQRRKQSNRESARRSRLRKQQECEDLARTVDELSSNNGTLRSEIERLKEQCGKLESENAAIKDELVRITGSTTAVLVELDDNAKSSADHCADGKGDSLSHQGVKGSENQPNGATFLSSSNGNHDPGHK